MQQQLLPQCYAGAIEQGIPEVHLPKRIQPCAQDLVTPRPSYWAWRQRSVLTNGASLRYDWEDDSRCVGFVIAGHDADGDFLCYRSYYYQSKVRKMTTYCVDILELMDAKKEDPEAKFAFSTIREKR